MTKPEILNNQITSTKILILFSIVFFLISCSPTEKRETVQILIQNTTGNVEEVKIVSYSMLSLEQSTLAKVTLDSSGLGNVQFDLNDPLMASIIINQQWIPIYLESDYDLEVMIEDDIIYYGHGSKANNYLARAFSIQIELEEANDTNIYELDQDSFLSRLDSIKSSLAAFHQHYLDSISLPIKITTLLEKRNSISLLNIKQHYSWNYAVHNSFIVPKTLDVTDQIPNDSTLLNVEMRGYADLWHILMHLDYYIPFGKKTSEERSEKEVSELIQGAISDRDYPYYIKELLYAKNIDHWLGTNGITPTIDALYTSFKSEYPKSTLLSLVDKHYNKWLTISNGQPAPLFSGFTPNGREVSLSDLKGKVVYIDVWGTWCAPCIREIPYSKILQKEFVDNEEIVFLYVSIDKDKEAWKKKVLDDSEWEGLHIINDGSISKAYIIYGLPRYIIIDKEGKIANIDAPRPSSGDVLVEELEKLL